MSKENEVERYHELNIPTDSRVPDGYNMILAYFKGDTVVIPINPDGLDENHDCDWEGCSSVSHCLRISPQQKYDLSNEGSLLKEKETELKKARDNYSELIMAVQSKFPNETRHDTALRYIKSCENQNNTPKKVKGEG